jgi:hypothetical protein
MRERVGTVFAFLEHVLRRYVALGLLVVAIISTVVWYSVSVLVPIIASTIERTGGA